MKTEEKTILKEHNNYLLKAFKNQKGKQMSIVAMSESGDVLHHFPNRMAASRYLVEHVRKEDPTDRKIAMKVYGNLYHGIKNAWQVYGYFWKLVPNGAPITTDAFFIINEEKCKYLVCYGDDEFDRLNEELGRFVTDSRSMSTILNNTSNEYVDRKSGIIVSNYNGFLSKNEVLGLELAQSYDEIL